MSLTLCHRVLMRGQGVARTLTRPPIGAPRCPLPHNTTTTTTSISKTTRQQFHSSMMKHTRNMVHLLGLPWKVSTTEVVDFLKDCSIVDEEKGIHMVRRKDGRFTGACYVELLTPSDVEKAMEHDRKFIGQRYIQVSHAQDEDFQQYLQQYKNVDPEENVFVRVRGLPPHVVTKEEIVEFFHDTVDIDPYQITLTQDECDSPTGEAFIELASREDLAKALGKPSVLGRRHGAVEISECSRSDKEARNSITGHMVLMRGLPFAATEEDVHEFLHPHEAVDVRFMLDVNHRSRGVCEVDFASHEGAVGAMCKDKNYMGRRYVDMFLHSQPGVKKDTEVGGVD